MPLNERHDPRIYGFEIGDRVEYEQHFDVATYPGVVIGFGKVNVKVQHTYKGKPVFVHGEPRYSMVHPRDLTKIG